MLRLSIASTLALALAAPAAMAQTAPATPPAQGGTATQPQPGTQTTTTAPAAGTTQTTTATPMQPKTVGGAQMLPTDTIVANASKANNLTTLVKAVNAAGLTATLSGPGPFTVFAPEDAAFGRLAPGTLDALMDPANKAKLTKLLTYHVVPGNLKAEDLLKQAQAAGGTTTLTTVAGDPITVATANGGLVLSDVSGNKSYITQFNVTQSNGVVHVVNGVLVPNLDAAPATPAATETPAADAPAAEPTPTN